jgi:3-oxoadipate enol-lactonase
MHKVEIRPGVWMAYEDDWFGAPWTTPEMVVLVHGNSESSGAWTQWVPHLAGKYRVVRPDLPGFGASPEPSEYGWSAPELAADIGRFLDALAIERCHLVGAKYGGSACMQFAADNSRRLRSLALFGSPFRGSGSGNADAIRAKGVRQWAAETQRARLGSDVSDAQIRWWTEDLMGKTSTRAAYSASSARIDMDLDAMLPRIAVPTLIVTTQESGLQSIATVERYAARLPDAEVTVLPGDSYHIAASAPDLCAQHALRFIESVSAGRHARRNHAAPAPAES